MSFVLTACYAGAAKANQRKDEPHRECLRIDSLLCWCGEAAPAQQKTVKFV
jgi:hypothetical protein